MSTSLPNPTMQSAALWLRTVNLDFLHNEGWREAEHRFGGIVAAARDFAHTHFAGNLEQQEAFFDGLALALVAMGHFADIERVQKLLAYREEDTELPPADVRCPGT